MSRVEFTVLGEPQPQGSKMVIQQKGRRPRMIEDNPDTKPWRERVERAAHTALDGREHLLDGPIRLRVTFVFSRPQSHFGTGRNSGLLKPSAPLYVRTRPDVDKLLRAIGDAITQTLVTDDSRIVVVHAEKHYGQPPCAHIVVDELDLEDDRAVEGGIDSPRGLGAGLDDHRSGRRAPRATDLLGQPQPQRAPP